MVFVTIRSKYSFCAPNFRWCLLVRRAKYECTITLTWRLIDDTNWVVTHICDNYATGQRTFNSSWVKQCKYWKFYVNIYQLSTASPEITTRDETVFVMLKMKPLGLVQLILGDAQAEGNMNEMTLKRCRGGWIGSLTCLIDRSCDGCDHNVTSQRTFKEPPKQVLSAAMPSHANQFMANRYHLLHHLK